MSSVRKFQFDESFDVDPGPRKTYGRVASPPPAPEPEPEPEPPPPPPPPTFGEADLAAAKAAGFKEGETAGRSAGYGQGFAEGHAAGRKDGYDKGAAETAAKVEARLAGALERLVGGIEELLSRRAAAAAMIQDQPVRLALAIVRKLLPEFSRRGGAAEVEGMVRACLTDLVDEPRLMVRVAPDMVVPVRERLDAMAASRGFDARLVIVDDPAIARGDARIEWAEGGAERDTARLLADIEAALERLLAVPAA